MKKLLLLSIVFFPIITDAQIVQSSKNDEEPIFEKIEIEAGFKVGIAKWNEFVRNNFNFSRIE